MTLTFETIDTDPVAIAIIDSGLDASNMAAAPLNEVRRSFGAFLAGS